MAETVRRFLLIVALLVIVPIIEIAVLIAVGEVVGLGWTLLLMLATSVLGGWLLRQQGARAWRAFRADLAEARPPGNAATDGLLVLVGGILMLVPGFVTDALGLLLIAAPSRRVARGLVLHLFTARLSPATATTLFGPRRVRVQHARPRPSDGEPIEGEILEPPPST